jgi:hypothetical protein
VNENSWRQSLWDFFAAAAGFWILKNGKSKVEKVVLCVVTVMVTLLVVLS